jgi:hypothetical protein
MFIATNFINLECELSYMMVPELYDVYLAMICTMMLLMMLLQCIKNMGVYFKTKKKLKCVYKYLSRMKLALLLSEWRQDDRIARYEHET